MFQQKLWFGMHKSRSKKWFLYHRTADVKPSGIFILQGFGGVAPNVCFATTYIHSILQQPTFCLCKKQICLMRLKSMQIRMLLRLKRKSWFHRTNGKNATADQGKHCYSFAGCRNHECKVCQWHAAGKTGTGIRKVWLKSFNKNNGKLDHQLCRPVSGTAL